MSRGTKRGSSADPGFKFFKKFFSLSQPFPFPTSDAHKAPPRKRQMPNFLSVFCDIAPPGSLSGSIPVPGRQEYAH